MKKLLIAIAFMATAAVAMAQGTVTFSNKDSGTTPPIDAPIFNVDGTTPLSGSGFLAQLYFAPAGSTASTVFTAAPGSALIFRTGTRAGYTDNTVDLNRVLTGIAAGAAADIQIRAWDASKGSTYEAALAAGGAVGKSPTLAGVITGGSGTPASLPTSLVGLQGFKLNVPEPTTIALGLLGAGALFLRRRK